MGCFGAQQEKPPPIIREDIQPCPQPNLPSLPAISDRETFRVIEDVVARERELERMLRECHAHYRFCVDSITACTDIVEEQAQN